VSFPCVLKPVSAHHWRKAGNWQLVGGRKAIPVSTPAELFAEYDCVARVESPVLLQQMVPGADDCLYVAACYLDRQGNSVAGFTAQKLLQVPEGFGTGCIVQAVDHPELLAAAVRLLQTMRFSGIAEVEFKRDATSGQYKLIEINPRAWDQHRLGKACGIDLVHIAYCDLMGLGRPPVVPQTTGQKWIADDVFCLVLLRALWKGDGTLRGLLRLARGRRLYAICSRMDPVPFLAFLGIRLLPDLAVTFLRTVRLWPRRLLPAGHNPLPRSTSKQRNTL